MHGSPVPPAENRYTAAMTRESPLVERFRDAYQGQPPWEAGHAQPAIVQVAPRMRGSVLDAGCGTGDNALYLSRQGHLVYGVDFVPEVIARAKEKATEWGVQACFLVLDALSLHELPLQFDNVVDCGLFHVLSDEDRVKYVASLASVLKPGGYLWLMCFSDKEPPGQGPRRISTADLHAALAQGWRIESIDEVQFDTAPSVPQGEYSAGGPHAYLAVVERSGGPASTCRQGAS